MLYVTVITEFKSGKKQLSPEFLHRQYIEKGLSTRQIAAQEVSSKEAVRAALHKNNIPVREQGQHHGHPSQLKYGIKRKGPSINIHQTEQRTIDAVRQMRGEGLGFRAIARCLDQMKVPTKNRGKKWHPEMVKRISGKSIECN